METILKQKALTQLARIEGEAAQTALDKEAYKITKALQTETQYDHITAQLELLDTIAYRVHEKAVEIVKHLLARLETLELTYQEILGYPTERLQEYQNNNTLIVKALEVLEHIRYHQPAGILDIFFQYSARSNEDVAKQAKHGLEKLAAYDLDIFYGDGKNWPGLGWGPQENVLEKILSFDDTQKRLYFSGIIAASDQMLSSTIGGTNWSYKSLTIRTAAIPALDGIKLIREKVLEMLQDLYPLAENIEQKNAVMNAMHSATRTPHTGNYGDDVSAMIMRDTLTVLRFMKAVVANEDLQIRQKIEHDVYFFFLRWSDQQVKDAALEVKAILDGDDEYQIFKILIGFQGVFSEWSEKEITGDDYDHEKALREQKAAEFAASITVENYPVWKSRILNYASINSKDMATFPYFGKFLENFGKSSPTLALRLLSEASDQLEGFLISILYGISETERKNEANDLIAGWIDQGRYLFSLARFFEFTNGVDENLFRKIYEAAKTNEDLDTLNQIIASTTAQYTQVNKHLIQAFFISALDVLTNHRNSGWIFGFWFRKQRSEILAAMQPAEHQAILDNLFWLNKIDYHAEEILSVIAKQSPELVLQFFCKRLSKEKDADDRGKYDAIPFSFHKLSKPLSIIPEQAVDIVLETYDGNYGMFIYRGARLLKNIFPDFPNPFKQKLVQIIQSKEEKNILFVIAILRNYEGEPFIHDVCKELVKALSDGGNLLNEVTFILNSTGVVSGEYGFVGAYIRKIEEIKPWLEDRDEKIQEFARRYISGLEKQIEYEKKRADEDIMLRKHQYGAGEEDVS